MEDLEALAAEFVVAAKGVREALAPVLQKGALNIKTEARANAAASAGTHARKYPAKITYRTSQNGLAVEIGPTQSGQGNLAPILEYGTLHNPPHRDLGRAADSEEPRFIAAVEALGLLWD